MPLDAQARAYLDLMSSAGIPPTHQLTPAEARAALVTRQALLPAAEPQPVGSIEDRLIPGPGGELKVRIYRPDDQGPSPIMVYFHGGGWVVGSVDTHDGVCRRLTNGVGCVVVSVDYRLAPEHKFPAAVEDAYAATCWTAEHAGELGGAAARLVVGGESAGGNLAAVVALMARDWGGPPIAYQVLLYPGTCHGFESPSLAENDGIVLGVEDIRWYSRQYLPHEAVAGDPYASPLRAPDLSGLPPALVVTAEYDPIRDEGEAYADRLRQAGVPVVSKRYPGLIHTFFLVAGMVDAAREAVEETCETLRTALVH